MPSTIPPWKLWLMAIRPPTLLAGLGPVLLGVSFGCYQLYQEQQILSSSQLWAGLAAFSLVVLLQSAANLVNDAKDAEKGVDASERLGPVRLVQRGLLSLSAVKKAYYLCFALAGLVAGLLFWWEGDVLMPAVAALCALAAYAYTAGPFPLSYYALGEVLALIFFGPIAVMGSSYLFTHLIDGRIAFWGVGPGLIAAAIMAINNLRDRQGDAIAGKRTLANLLGARVGRLLPLALLSSSVALCGLYGLLHQKGPMTLLLVCAFSLIIGRGIWPLLHGPAAALNQALKRTALFNFAYALGFALMVCL